MLTGQVTNAGVSDSLGLGSIAAFLGLAAPDSVRTDYGGTLVERVNYLEQQNKKLTEQNESLAAQMAGLITKTDNLATKEQIKDLATKEDVENVSKAANASYNLYVYIPKNIATGNYDGQKVTIISSSGNQNSSATLRDDGVNYSATLYFNFNGNCRLNFNILGNNTSAATEIYVTVSATGQEKQLLVCEDPNFAHVMCQSGIADRFYTSGLVLNNGWIVVSVQNNALQLWRKSSIGKMEDYCAQDTANKYWQTYNAENGTNAAFSSGQFSERELGSGWLAGNNRTNYYYWTSTYNAGRAEFLSFHDGTFYYGIEEAECLPYVWIH